MTNPLFTSKWFDPANVTYLAPTPEQLHAGREWVKHVREYMEDTESVFGVPQAIINLKGKIKWEYINAPCMGALYGDSVASVSDGDWLIIYPHFDPTYSGRSEWDDDDKREWVDYVTTESSVAPFFYQQSFEDYMKNGIFLRLYNVPRNAPLMASTWVRFMWDSYGGFDHAKFVRLRNKYKLSPFEMRVVGETIRPFGDFGYRVSIDDGGHSPFGHEIKVETLRMLQDGFIPNESWDSRAFNPRYGKGIGIAEMMMNMKGTRFNDAIVKKLKGMFQTHASTRRMYIPVDKEEKIVSAILSILKGE